MTQASGALAALLADAREADPVHRIDLRDPIAAHGAAAIEAIGPWLREPALAAVAIRVIARAGPDRERAPEPPPAKPSGPAPARIERPRTTSRRPRPSAPAT